MIYLPSFPTHVVTALIVAPATSHTASPRRRDSRRTSCPVGDKFLLLIVITPARGRLARSAATISEPETHIPAPESALTLPLQNC